MSYHSFEDLKVWKKALKLSIDIYKSIKNSKEFELKNQLLRSAISIPSNIAEGIERDSAKDSKRFIKIALGSSAELRTQLYIAKSVEIIDKDVASGFIEESRGISKMLFGLIKYLDKIDNKKSLREYIVKYEANV